MPARSQKQQKLAGMADAYLKGDMPGASPKVKQFASMGRGKVRDFAKTKRKGLPKKARRGQKPRGGY